MSFVGEGLDNFPVFWLIFWLGLPVEMLVGKLIAEEDAWSEVAVAEAEALVGDA